MLRCLGNLDGKDSVVEAGADGVLLDLPGEIEGPAELADAALAAPVLRAVSGCGLLRLLGLLGSLLLGRSGGFDVDFGSRPLAVLILVLYRGLVALGRGGGLVVVAFACRASLVTFHKTGDGRLRSVRARDAAVNTESVRVGELDINVLLLQTSEFAVKLKVAVEFADIKLRLEGNGGAGGATIAIVSLASVGVEVFEKTEKRREADLGVVVVAGEEGHLVWYVGARAVLKVKKNDGLKLERSCWKLSCVRVVNALLVCWMLLMRKDWQK